MRQIINGFRALHDKHIVHRDIKPANILLHNGVAKIADFGFSKVVEHGMESMQIESLVGSPIYMSPQLLSGQVYSSKADLWSLAITWYELLYG